MARTLHVPIPCDPRLNLGCWHGCGRGVLCLAPTAPPWLRTCAISARSAASWPLQVKQTVQTQGMLCPGTRLGPLEAARMVYANQGLPGGQLGRPGQGSKQLQAGWIRLLGRARMVLRQPGPSRCVSRRRQLVLALHARLQGAWSWAQAALQRLAALASARCAGESACRLPLAAPAAPLLLLRMSAWALLPRRLLPGLPCDELPLAALEPALHASAGQV